MAALRVLVADDESDLAQMLALRLRAAGMEVRVAGDGAAALRVAQDWLPALVLTDISMPGLDGWQLCEALERDIRFRRIPVVAMTAWVTADLERRARQAGVGALLLKPFDERRIASIVALAAAQPREKSSPDAR
jgi:CheY-like chemotaxis protein